MKKNQQRVKKHLLPTGKPIKRGMKVWMRCDSTSGYCHQFNIYMGKDDPNKGTEVGQKVVKLLCKDLKWKDHHVYMDRYIMLFCNTYAYYDCLSMKLILVHVLNIHFLLHLLGSLHQFLW